MCPEVPESVRIQPPSGFPALPISPSGSAGGGAVGAGARGATGRVTHRRKRRKAGAKQTFRNLPAVAKALPKFDTLVQE